MSRWMRAGGVVALAAGMTMATPAPAWAGPPDPGAQTEAFFETKVRPLLSASCLKCHGEQKQSAGLRLDSREAMLAGNGDGAAVARGQQRVLIVPASVPDRADRVDDVPCGELVTTGDLRVACGTAAERTALGQQFGSRATVDGPVNASPAEQRGVGGVDDRINVKRRDVGDDHLQLRSADGTRRHLAAADDRVAGLNAVEVFAALT